MILHLSNLGGTQACFFTVADSAYGTAPVTVAVAASATATVIRPLQANFGWYDLSIRSSSDGQFLRRVAGHVETGSAGRTDPQIGTNRHQTPALSAAAGYVQQGLAIPLSYAAPAGKYDAKNWIGIYGPGTSPGKRSAAQWVYAPQASGSWAAGSEGLAVADYTVWYLYRDGYEVLGGPLALSVTRLDTDSATVQRGQLAAFRFAIPSSKVRTKNWIGLWPAGTAPESVKWLAWKYVSTASGNVSFDTTTLAAGHYAAWMMFDDGYQRLGGPCSFTVSVQPNHL